MHCQGILINRARVKSLGYTKPRTLLDIGAGPGTFLEEAKKKGWSVYGTEVGNILYNRLARQFGRSHIFKGEVQKIKFGKLKFDAVTLWHVFEHIPNVHQTLRSIKKIMAKNSLLIIEVPHARSLNFMIFKNYRTLLMPPQHLHFWSESSLRQLLNSYNVKIVKVSYPVHFPYVFASSLIGKYRFLLVVSPFIVLLSVVWAFLISLFDRGDVIRVYARL
ncbi:class I SAM-dependent methyltransferase [Candidatus Daviesbacteria bacterium]|nr:class I SAM-dependent methyltransferase [Candidatus Daviesbacteria bacterium]